VGEDVRKVAEEGVAKFSEYSGEIDECYKRTMELIEAMNRIGDGGVRYSVLMATIQMLLSEVRVRAHDVIAGLLIIIFKIINGLVLLGNESVAYLHQRPDLMSVVLGWVRGNVGGGGGEGDEA